MLTVGAQINKKQTGAGLIEVMVALLLLGVGMLGILNMQTRSLDFNQQAYLHSQATGLLRDIVERIRANPSVANSYELSFGSSASTVTDCAISPCSATQLAEWDKNTWLETVQTILPQGDAEIDFSSNNRFTVVIEYDRDQGASGELSSASMTVRLGE